MDPADAAALHAHAVRLPEIDAEQRLRDPAVAHDDVPGGNVDARGVPPEIAAPHSVDVEPFQNHTVRADAHDAAFPGAREEGPPPAHETDGPVEHEIARIRSRPHDDGLSRRRAVHPRLQHGRLRRERPPLESPRCHRRHFAGDLQEEGEGQRDHREPAARADARLLSRQASAIERTRTTATRPRAYDPTPGYE